MQLFSIIKLCKAHSADYIIKKRQQKVLKIAEIPLSGG